VTPAALVAAVAPSDAAMAMAPAASTRGRRRDGVNGMRPGLPKRDGARLPTDAGWHAGAEGPERLITRLVGAACGSGGAPESSRSWRGGRSAAPMHLDPDGGERFHRPMSVTAEEIATQPRLWRQALTLAEATGSVLPAPGARVCAIGCGTSCFIAQAYAGLRESAGLGETDAFAASELPVGRAYDVLVAISRSGATSEVVRALERAPARRTVALTAVPDSAVAAVADETVDLAFADERSVVQTRFATTALALLRAQADRAGVAAAADDAERALADALPLAAADVEQWAFVAHGWAVGLAHEAALKLREGCQAWAESYPAYEYRHGPISIAAPGRCVWALTPLDAAMTREIRATGATLLAPRLDPMASLVLVQRVMLALADARGLDPDHPRNLTRSVVLGAEELDGLR
jgi:fructoselysine-6-P-deglycase FrlB-like protein